MVKEGTRFNFVKARSLGIDESLVYPIQYRPFDNRYIYYQDYFIERARKEIMQNFLNNNIGLVVCRQQKTEGFYHALVNRSVVESSYVSNKTAEIGYSFPLYLYSSDHAMFDKSLNRKPNINIQQAELILCNIGEYEWVDDHVNKKSGNENVVSPLDIIDYVYAILYSPVYRERYKDFLKSDFPRIPPATNKGDFWVLARFGGQLRRLHLLEDPGLSNLTTTFSEIGENQVERVEYKDGNVFINEKQFFGNVPKIAWELYIGGYQPAQKWLKDRMGQILSYDEIVHYQKMIISLTETSKIMNEISTVNFIQP